MKLSTFGSSARNFAFEKTESCDDEDGLKILTTELEEQKTRTQEMQTTIDEQNQLLKSIAKQLQNLSYRATTPLGLSLDDIDGSFRSFDRSQGDVVSGTPPAEL
jgi:hypothetical protein